MAMFQIQTADAAHPVAVKRSSVQDGARSSTRRRARPSRQIRRSSCWCEWAGDGRTRARIRSYKEEVGRNHGRGEKEPAQWCQTTNQKAEERKNTGHWLVSARSITFIYGRPQSPSYTLVHPRLLPVACKPAVELGILFPVTGYAKIHLEIDSFQPVLAFHIPMTIRTVKLRPLHMGNVIKKHKIRYPEDSYPGHRLVRCSNASPFFDLRMIPNNILVAEETFLQRGQACVGTGPHSDGRSGS